MKNDNNEAIGRLAAEMVQQELKSKLSYAAGKKITEVGVILADLLPLFEVYKQEVMRMEIHQEAIIERYGRQRFYALPKPKQLLLLKSVDRYVAAVNAGMEKFEKTLKEQGKILDQLHPKTQEGLYQVSDDYYAQKTA